MIKLNILIDSAKYIDPNDTRDEQLNRQTEKLALAEKQCTQDVEKSAREALITYATQPDDASALNLLTSQVKAGQWEQILSTGSLLEGLYPNRRIRLYRSQALFMTGKLDEALKLLTQRAPWQSPDEQAIYAADYLDLEGKIRYELGQVPEAIARWEQALAQARPPEKPRLQFLLKLVKGEPNWQVDEAKHNSLYRRCANRKPLGQTLSGKLAQKYQQAKLKQPQTVTPIH
nr:hypothetical protein [Candidatus Cyanaurora vandensis]